MKRTSTRTSTTATPSFPRFTIGPIGPRGLVVALASSTAVTLPTAAFLLHGENLALTLGVGLLPAALYLIVAVAFVAIYTVTLFTAVVVTVFGIALSDDDPGDRLHELFGWICNVPIAFLTLTPLKPRDMKTVKRTPPVAPLPAGHLGAARKQGTPVYWETLQEMATRRGGSKDIVDLAEPTAQPVRGRHERSEPSPDQDHASLVGA